MNATTVIHFTNASAKLISWTSIMRKKHGNYPIVQLWLSEGGLLRKIDEPLVETHEILGILLRLSVNLTGTASGFVVIK